jgi:hypothetical protein
VAIIESKSWVYNLWLSVVWSYRVVQRWHRIAGVAHSSCRRCSTLYILLHIWWILRWRDPAACPCRWSDESIYWKCWGNRYSNMSHLRFERSDGWPLPRPSARDIPLALLKMRRFLWYIQALSIAKDIPRWEWSNQGKNRPTGWHCNDIVRWKLSTHFGIGLLMDYKWRHRGCHRRMPQIWELFRYRMSFCRSGRTIVSS